MFDPWGSENSTLREKVVEHLFLAELSKEMLLRAKTPFEVLRSEFDGHGYDVVVEARGVLRYIQFKHSRADSTVRRQKINLALTRKRGGCVIWSLVDRDTMALGPFFWLSGKPGHRLGNIKDKKIATHTKGNQIGFKAPRQAIRVVNRGDFTKINSISELAKCLFGDMDAPMKDPDQEQQDYWMSLAPPERRWAEKSHSPIGASSSGLPPEMLIERRDGSLTSHFRFADGSWRRQPELAEHIDFPIERDGFYDLGGGYLGESPPV